MSFPRLLSAAGLLLVHVVAARASEASPGRQAVAGQQVADAASAYLRRQLEPGHTGVEVTPLAVPADVAVGPGAVSLQVRELSGMPLRPRMVLWVDVRGGVTPSRPVPVALAVRAMRQVMTARRNLGAGELAAAEDFEVQLRDVAGLPAPPAPSLAPGTRVRLRKALAAGGVLLQAAQSSAAGVLRGDRVRLLAGRGALALESAALALSDGEPGQQVSVRAAQSEAAVQAIVAGAGVVRLED